MSQELVSSKYLTVDYEAQEQPESDNSSTPDSNPIPQFSRRKLPTGIYVLSGFFVLISMLGMYSAVNTLTKLYFHQSVSADLSGLGNDSRSRRMKREIREMESRAAEAKTKYLPYQTYNEILKLALSIGFAITVGLLIIRNPNARKFAITVCCVALFYHLSAITISCISTAEVLGPMGNLFDASTANAEEFQSLSASEKAEAKATFSRVMTGGFMIFIGIYLFSKFVFYGICIVYLGRQDIQELYASPAEISLPTPQNHPETAVPAT